MNAIRTWKRDGSINKMPLLSAIDNLVNNAVGDLRGRPRAVEMALMSGGRIETPLAVFKLAAVKEIK